MSLHFFRVTGSSSGRWISRVVWRGINDWQSTMCFSPVLSRIHLMVVKNLRFGGRSESEWGLQILTDQTDCWTLGKFGVSSTFTESFVYFFISCVFPKEKTVGRETEYTVMWAPLPREIEDDIGCYTGWLCSHRKEKQKILLLTKEKTSIIFFFYLHDSNDTTSNKGSIFSQCVWSPPFLVLRGSRTRWRLRTCVKHLENLWNSECLQWDLWSSLFTGFPKRVYYEAIKRELNRRRIWVSVWWKTKS